MEEKQRHYYIKHDRPIPSDQAIFALLRRYSELPTRDILKILNRDYETGVNRLNQLADQGKLLRHKPNTKISKDYSFAIDEPGNRSPTQRSHRIYESLIGSSTEIGVRDDLSFSFIGWDDMLLGRNTPPVHGDALKLLDSGRNPHLIKLSDGHLIPDGHPQRIYCKEADQHVTIFTEADRRTEPLTTTAERRSIEEKLEHYREFFDHRLYINHYGFQRMGVLLRIVTKSESRLHAMIRLYENRYGPCKHILFKYWPDWAEERSYPPTDGDMFTTAYKRVGYPDYFLNSFPEMDKPEHRCG